MKENNNLFRPQVYFQRKEEIDELKEDFMASGSNNKSQYFHDLIMLGLKVKKEAKEEMSKVDLDSIDFKIDAALLGLETISNQSLTEEEKKEAITKLKQVLYDLVQVKSKLDDLDKRLSIHEKVLANIYQFTSPTFGNRKNIESGEYDVLPKRFNK